MALRFNGQSLTGAVGCYSAFPGRIVGNVTAGAQQTNSLFLWSASRNFVSSFSELAAVPDGANHPATWVMALQAGRISARGTTSTFSLSAQGVRGLPGVGAANITFAVGPSQLQLVVSAQGSSSVSFTVQGAVAGALLAQGVSSVNFTVNAATLGAIINATGSGQVTFSESVTLTALGNISGAVTPFTELSPESLAAAVWNAIASEYNLVNTMGELLNSGGGGGGRGGGATPAQIWSYATRTLTASPGPSAATIATQVRTELNTELNRIDANISSRLPTASYTAPPSVSAIRTEMDTNSTKLDATISSRLAASSYTAPPSVSAIRTEMDTNSTKLDATISSRALETTAQAIKTKTDNLPASPAAVGDIPTAAANATAVRTELTTELGRIDVATSTRLATASYTAPPSVSAIRTEMDTNSTKLDATVSSRLAASSYTAPPSVSAIRTEMDTNSTKLDVAVGTRLASAAYTAPPSVSAIRTEMDTNSTKLDATISSRALETTAQAIKAKTDNLPASPAATGDVPSAATVASAVRTELTTELGRIDVATSTRLAASAYTAAPSASTVASAVRTELTTELGRIDVAVSSRNATAPDNASIAAIKAKTDTIPASPASEATVQATLDAAKLAAALSA